jgi:hypothetical protein
VNLPPVISPLKTTSPKKRNIKVNPKKHELAYEITTKRELLKENCQKGIAKNWSEKYKVVYYKKNCTKGKKEKGIERKIDVMRRCKLQATKSSWACWQTHARKEKEAANPACSSPCATGKKMGPELVLLLKQDR